MATCAAIGKREGKVVRNQFVRAMSFVRAAATHLELVVVEGAGLLRVEQLKGLLDLLLLVLAQLGAVTLRNCGRGREGKM
jgi:hypothetical protein